MYVLVALFGLSTEVMPSGHKCHNSKQGIPFSKCSVHKELPLCHSNDLPRRSARGSSAEAQQC